MAGFRTKRNDNHGCCDNRNNRCELCTADDVLNIYHACKYLSIAIATTVLNIQRSALYVNAYSVFDKGSSINNAEAIPDKIEEATRKEA